MFSASGHALAVRHPHPPKYRLVAAARTHVGQLREGNEDNFGVHQERGLFIVADGMGGAAAGEVASRLAVELVSEALLDADVTWPLGMAPPPTLGLSRLVAAIERANHCIHGAAQTTPGWVGMGTTIAVALVCDDRMALAHVGDSRIYRLRGGRLELMTEDHSLFNALVRAGYADPDHPENFENHNMITRALGLEASVEVDARLIELIPGDAFLLCSDGLSGLVAQPEIADILLAYRDLDAAAERLIERANELGGTDNITAVLARVG
jgi:serine/threonine protein phosphatase PrpC